MVTDHVQQATLESGRAPSSHKVPFVAIVGALSLLIQTHTRTCLALRL